MGLCSNTEKRIDEEIQNKLIAEHKSQRFEVRCMLFGVRNSGKTTMMKQLNALLNHDKENDHISKSPHIHQIRQRCVDNFIALCHILHEYKVITLLRTLSIYKNEDLDKISDIISSIWHNQISKIKFKFRHYYNYNHNLNVDCILDDNSDYFFDKVDEVMDMDYQPTTWDIIHCKTCSNAVKQIPMNWDVKGYNTRFGDRLFFSLIDSGMDGNSHRRTVRNVLFGSAEYIIFVAALSDYCCYDIDSYEGNSMQQSLEYFDFIINSQHYRRFDVILIFTKMNVFKNCLNNGISLEVCFGDEWNENKSDGLNGSNSSFIVPEFLRQCNVNFPQDLILLIIEYSVEESRYDKVDEAFEFIKQQYLNQDENSHSYRDIKTWTCDTLDTNDVASTFQSIQNYICIRSYSKTDLSYHLQLQGKDWPKWPN